MGWIETLNFSSVRVQYTVNFSLLCGLLVWGRTERVPICSSALEESIMEKKVCQLIETWMPRDVTEKKPQGVARLSQKAMEGYPALSATELDKTGKSLRENHAAELHLSFQGQEGGEDHLWAFC